MHYTHLSIARRHPRLFTAVMVGRWLIAKARGQAAEHGIQQAARNLRKQGAPLELALAILVPGAKA